MATQKIQLNLYDVTGPAWTALLAEDISNLEQMVRDLPVLGTQPRQHTMTAVSRFDNVTAGFFAVQYEREVLDIDQNKKGTVTYRAEWERTAFALFPQIGKLLLQARKYPKGLSKDMVFQDFKDSINYIMREGKLSNTTLVTVVAEQEIPDKQFIETFDNPTNRVEKMIVDNLRSDQSMLEGLTYYNPQRERNMVVGQHLSHDFGVIKRLFLESDEKRSDLRRAHIAKAAVRSGRNEEMRYQTESGQKHVLKRKVQENYDMLIDMEADPMRLEDVQKMAEQVLEQFGLYRQPRIPDALPDQSSIFDMLENQ